ncbi:MAG: hypothetical protein ACOC0W_02165 [Desulfosalsimonas sp.]
MAQETAIDHAVKYAETGLVFVSTTNDLGVPHLAAAGTVSKPERGRISVTEWFCPATAENAVPGRPISVVVWDSAHDLGHQIIGRVSAVEEISMLDGYQPNEHRRSPVPQVKRRLIIDVEQVTAFSKAPHSDIEE